MNASVRPAARPVTPTTIAGRELRAVTESLREGDVIDGETLDRLRRATAIVAGLDAYLDDSATPESAALAHLAERTRATDWNTSGAVSSRAPLEQEMLSGHVEGRFLQFLVRLARAVHVLEIGMFTGYSALAMAEALPADGRVTACEIDADVAAFARECFDESPAGERIDVEVGPAIETLGRLDAQCTQGARQRFDLVFLDADKPGYLGYLRALLDGHLLADDAVIAVDNTLMQGEPYLDTAERSTNGHAIAEFNAAVMADERIESILLPLRDGVTLIRRRTPAPVR